MNYKVDGENIILTAMNSFKISEILECGQCFRFTKVKEDEYKIIAKGKVLTIKQKGKEITFTPCTKDEFEKIWIDYFDLSLDYDVIKDQFRNDLILKEAIKFGEGIRILNQDEFECLISFIISQNNRIPMIKKVINNISEKYGTKVGNDYLFPTVEQLSKATLIELRQCKTGFRDKYIVDAIEKITTNKLDIYAINNLSTDKLKKELMTIKGVGEKVSDCVLLFAFNRKERFPVDVWVKRVMENLYFNNEDTDKAVIERYAKNNFGNYAGIAQQYLFNYAFHKKVGK